MLEEAYLKVYIKEEEDKSEDNLTENEGEKQIKEDDSEKVYKIEENIYNKFLEDVEKINKRAAKYKFPKVELQVIDKKELPEYRQFDSKSSTRTATGRYLTWYFVKVVSPPPILDGWKFVARIDHESFGNIIVKSPQSKYKGSLTQEYGDKAPKCDHCKTIRDRKATFVIEKDGKIQTVGRSCLKDYVTGDPYAFIQYADTLSWLLGALLEENNRGESDDFGSSRGGIGRYNIADALAYMYQTAKKVGYVSKKKENESRDEFGQAANPSTVSVYIEMMNDPKKRPKDTDESIEERKKLGEEILSWGRQNVPEMYQRELDKGGNYADYYGNLSTLLKGSEGNATIEEKHLALLGSVIGLYLRWQDNQEKEKVNKSNDSSQWIGEVGEKLKGFDANVISVRPYRSDYGISHRVNLQDDNGNNFTWWSKDPSLADGDRIKIEVATVKKHDDFKGIKSTTLLRVKFVKLEGGQKTPIEQQQQLKPAQTQEKNYLSEQEKHKIWMDFWTSLTPEKQKMFGTTGGGHKLMVRVSNALSNKCTKEELDKLIAETDKFLSAF